MKITESFINKDTCEVISQTETEGDFTLFKLTREGWENLFHAGSQPYGIKLQFEDKVFYLE